MNNYIDNLLARYFGGDASEQDMHLLENWLSESDENQRYFDQMTALYEKLQPSANEVPAPKTIEAKKAFLKYISSHDTAKPVIEFKKKPFYQNWMFRAASILLIALFSAIAYYQINSVTEIVLATQAQSNQFQLPDETTVVLSENSKIIYNSNFSKKDKILELIGEASFDVGHLGKTALQIKAGETFIEDIGTVFDVEAQPESDFVSVSVKDGKIHFYTATNKGLILNASETGVYYKKTKKFKILAQPSKNGIAGSKHLDFQNMALGDAVDIIANAYNIDVKLTENSLATRRITVNFDGEDADIVLQIIAETLSLNLETNEKGFQLSNRN